MNPNRVYRNNGDNTFTDIAGDLGMADMGYCRGLAVADWDDDGDVDVLFNNIMSGFTPGLDTVLLYRNDLANGNHWLKVRCVGTVNNRDAFGAKVEITVGGESWIDEIHGGSSHASQNSSIVHFGLGTATVADRVAVIWPGGQVQELFAVAADQTITVVEDTAAMRLAVPFASPALSVRPNPMLESTRVLLDLPAAASVSVTVYDPAGRSIACLFDGPLQAGRRQIGWDGRDAAGCAGEPGRLPGRGRDRGGGDCGAPGRAGGGGAVGEILHYQHIGGKTHECRIGGCLV